MENYQFVHKFLVALHASYTTTNNIIWNQMLSSESYKREIPKYIPPHANIKVPIEHRKYP
jgi:hypothetical protein